MSRRQFLAGLAGSAAVGRPGYAQKFSAPPRDRSLPEAPRFKTRGVVLVPDDLTWTPWVAHSKAAGLTTVALHHGSSPKLVMDFIRSGAGQRFLEECRRHGLEVEYELHAVRELLPRRLFAKNPELFRMNAQGARSADANLCLHSETALAIAAEQAVQIAQVLRPTTGRYFYWGDDAQAWCHCSDCKAYSETDQALLLANHLLGALQKFDPKAQLAHLAYSNTLLPPKQVRPRPGIFLEFAPINRRYDVPYAKQAGREAKDGLELLDANLEIFDRETAQALEYWLDVSRFSRWKKPAVRLPWDGEIFTADLDTYAARGIRHITSFAVFIDQEYVSRYGPPQEVLDYGKRLKSRKTS